MKALFHWAENHTDVPTDIFVANRGEAINDPVAKADHVVDKWQGTWSEGTEAAREAERQVKAFLADHKTRGGNTPLLTPPETTRGICRSFPKRASISTDWWEFDEMAELPDEALRQYTARPPRRRQGKGGHAVRHPRADDGHHRQE